MERPYAEGDRAKVIDVIALRDISDEEAIRHSMCRPLVRKNGSTDSINEPAGLYGAAIPEDMTVAPDELATESPFEVLIGIIWSSVLVDPPSVHLAEPLSNDWFRAPLDATHSFTRETLSNPA